MDARRLRIALAAPVVALLALGSAGVASAARPVSGSALLAIDRAAGFRNFLPTTMLSGFKYSSWSKTGGVVRVVFRDKAGRPVVWSVEPMKGDCDTGKQGSYQLNGNKVWWRTTPTTQYSWRCAFGLDGKPLRLVASSTISPTKLGTSGLGIVAASAKRY